NENKQSFSATIAPLVECIRFPLMNQRFICDKVFQHGFLSDDELLGLFRSAQLKDPSLTRFNAKKRGTNHRHYNDDESDNIDGNTMFGVMTYFDFIDWLQDLDKDVDCEVEWNSNWWDARTTHADGNKIRITYPGYADTWDEVIGRQKYNTTNGFESAIFAFYCCHVQISSLIHNSNLYNFYFHLKKTKNIYTHFS
ncbi:hypothetical protein RFI_27639, partial [Reticulomyxa filosa]